MSPLVFKGSAYNGGRIFVPTLRMPTSPLVHVEPTMGPSSPTPHKEAVQIVQILDQDIKLVQGLQRSQHLPAYAPDCKTSDGM